MVFFSDAAAGGGGFLAALDLAAAPLPLLVWPIAAAAERCWGITTDKGWDRSGSGRISFPEIKERVVRKSGHWRELSFVNKFRRKLKYFMKVVLLGFMLTWLNWIFDMLILQENQALYKK